MRRLLLIVLTAAVAAATARAQTAPVFQIFSARLDGTDARSLSRADARGAFRGPGRRVFFVGAGGDGTAAFWVMNEDGSGQRQLGAAPGDGYFGPAWSPDGRTVGITRWDDSTCTPTSGWGCAAPVLVLVDAETGAERLVLPPRDRGAGPLSWAPDGSRLAFASELDSDRAAHAIETIRPNGSGRRVVVRLPAGPGIYDAAWSPRGDVIAYHRGDWIWLVRPQGGASTKLVRGQGPVWSPNGRRLLFQRRDDSIGLVDLVTRRTRVLGRAAEVGGGAWSPDGGRVAFLFRTRGVGVWSIAVVRVSDGRRLHTWRPGDDVGSLFFTRDGTRLVYSRSVS